MTAHLSPLEAYRHDLLRLGDREAIGADDAAWIVLAHVTWRLAAHVAARSTVADEHTTIARRAATSPPRSRALDPDLAAALSAAHEGDVAPLARVAGDGALRMEQAGAFVLAATTLSALRRVMAAAPGVDPLALGRVVAQWARVERHLGDFDVAHDLYDEAARIGRRHRVADLVVRADLGRAVLARIRGNYPEARAGFRRGLRRADRAGLGELTGLAHQGLLIAAAVAGDFDTALTHGWAAFAQVAGDPGKEAEVLVNLATLCLDARESAAALSAFTAAAARTRDVRTWLSATVGRAAAAARRGRRDVVESCAAAVERTLASEGTPYERAHHLLTLCTAFADVGAPEVAEAYRVRGLALARAHAFAELELEYAAPRPPVAATERAAEDKEVPSPLGRGARRVVRAIGALAAHDDAPIAHVASARGEEGGDAS